MTPLRLLVALVLLAVAVVALHECVTSGPDPAQRPLSISLTMADAP